MNIFTTSVLIIAASFSSLSHARSETLNIEIQNSRVLNLTAKTSDPGSDLQWDTQSDNDLVGPYFTVQGDIVEINGKPAKGKYICWGVFTTDFEAALKGEKAVPAIGITAVNQIFYIEGRGTVNTVGPEMSEHPIAVVGGTGDFVGAAGEIRMSGVDFPYGDGDLHVEVKLNRTKPVH